MVSAASYILRGQGGGLSVCVAGLGEGEVGVEVEDVDDGQHHHQDPDGVGLGGGHLLELESHYLGDWTLLATAGHVDSRTLVTTRANHHPPGLLLYPIYLDTYIVRNLEVIVNRWQNDKYAEL